jgi:hypothetical protein
MLSAREEDHRVVFGLGQGVEVVLLGLVTPVQTYLLVPPRPSRSVAEKPLSTNAEFCTVSADPRLPGMKGRPSST